MTRAAVAVAFQPAGISVLRREITPEGGERHAGGQHPLSGRCLVFARDDERRLRHIGVVGLAAPLSGERPRDAKALRRVARGARGHRQTGAGARELPFGAQDLELDLPAARPAQRLRPGEPRPRGRRRLGAPPSRPEGHGDRYADREVVGLELHEVLVEVVVAREPQVLRLRGDHRLEKPSLDLGRARERLDLPIDRLRFRIARAGRRQVLRRARLREGRQGILREDERLSRGPVEQPLQLELVEIRLDRAVEKPLLGAGDLEARRLDVEIGGAAFAPESDRPAGDRLPRHHAGTRRFEQPGARPVPPVREHDRARRLLGGPLGGRFPAGRGRSRSESRGAAGRVVERAAHGDAEDGGHLPGDQDRQARRIARRRSRIGLGVKPRFGEAGGRRRLVGLGSGHGRVGRMREGARDRGAERDGRARGRLLARHRRVGRAEQKHKRRRNEPNRRAITHGGGPPSD